MVPFVILSSPLPELIYLLAQMPLLAGLLLLVNLQYMLSLLLARRCPRCNCCFLAAGNAAVATAGIANATYLAVAGRAAVTAACRAAFATAGEAALAAGRAALSAGRAALADSRAAVTATGMPSAACLASCSCCC